MLDNVMQEIIEKRGSKVLYSFLSFNKNVPSGTIA
jgi:hypothetical protein